MSKPIQQRRFVAMVTVCLALITASILLIGPNGSMNSTELALFKYVYGLPESLIPFFRIITFLGSLWLVIGVIAGLALAKHFVVALRLAAAASIASFSSVVLKQIIMRPRPFLADSSVLNRDLPTAGFGFPSTHTALAFAAALLLVGFVPKSYRPWLIAGAVLVGVSRLYLGVHAPLDVLAGAALGGLSAIVARLIHVPKMHRKGRTAN